MSQLDFRRENSVGIDCFWRRSWELGKSYLQPGNSLTLDPNTSQEQHYINPSHSSQLVNPQSISLQPGAHQGSMNNQAQLNIKPLYLVDGSQGSMYNGAMYRQRSGHVMDIDPALPNENHVSLNQQIPSARRETERPSAFVPSQHSKLPPSSRLAAPRITYGPPSSDGFENHAYMHHKSDRSSSRPPMTTDEETSRKVAEAVSEIAKRLCTSHLLGKKDLDLVIRTIKSEADDLLDSGSKKARKGNHGDSPGGDTGTPEYPFKCSVCSKGKRTQCDLKYSLSLFLLGHAVR